MPLTSFLTPEQRTVLDTFENAGGDETIKFDISGASIKTAYEGEADTNAFTDALKTKLDGIETSATADQTDSEIETAYNNQVPAGTDAEISTGTETAIRRWSPQELNQAITSINTTEKSYIGGYDAATNTPDLDTTPIAGIKKGDVYDVTVAGNFFTIAVEIGDSLRAKQASPTLESHWVVVQGNLTAASIKTQYESNANTNAYTDAEKTIVGNQSGTNTGDEPNASTTVVGVSELATQAETEAKSDGTRAVTPQGLVNFPIKKAFDIVGNSSATVFTLTHSLGTKDVSVSIYDKQTDEDVIVDVKRTTADPTNKVDVTFAVAPTTGTDYRAIIIG